MKEESENIKIQINLLQQEIELQESNYKMLLRQHPNYSELKTMRQSIRNLRQKLFELNALS
jgi:Tfp pilus assembly protein PilO